MVGNFAERVVFTAAKSTPRVAAAFVEALRKKQLHLVWLLAYFGSQSTFTAEPNGPLSTEASTDLYDTRNKLA